MPETKAHILLVEDESFLANMYQTKLQLEGYNTEIAINGEEALQKLAATAYDLVLLDIMMPKLNGFAVLKSIRQEKNKTRNDVPVVVLTNLGQKNDIEQGLLLGANDYLVKANFTPSEVVQKIKKYV